MVQNRLFVGNLPDNITGPEVSSKFASFGTVQSTEVKTKNEATFAFVSLLVEDDRKLRQCIDVLNNTKWRGNLIKVQLAKESFLDKLKKEQAERAKQVSVISFEDEEEGNEGRGKHMYLPATQPVSAVTSSTSLSTRATSSKEPNYQNQEKRSSGVAKPKQITEGESSSDDSDDESAVFRPPPFRGLGAYPELNQVATPKPTVSSVGLESHSKEEPGVVNHKLVNPATQTNSVEAVESNVPAAGLAKLQEKLLAIAGAGGSKRHENKFTSRTPSQNLQYPKTRQSQQGGSMDQELQQTSQVDQTKVSNSSNSTPLNFKKRNSDLIRQKSLETRQNLNKSRSDIIKSSLLNINIQPPAQKPEPGKTPGSSNNLSSTLFDDDQEDNEEELGSEFKIKPQYEGESGQKNLELSSKFSAYDSRFIIDKRFREEENVESADKINDEDFNIEKENLSHFSILSDILGTRVTSEPQPAKLSSTSGSKPSCIVQRYDPENDSFGGDGNLQKPLNKKRKKGEDGSTIDANSSVQLKAKDDGAQKEEPKIATYHVASNLKDLFSSDSAQPSFSLLQTFGPASDINTSAGLSSDIGGMNSSKISKIANSSKGGSSNSEFWQKKNPFKYDSSDSEEEEITAGGNDTTRLPNSARKDRFFFKRNDKRFQGIEDYFLKNEENMDDVLYRFNNGERQELRLICRGKLKNTKRKSEKRIESLKRYKRKIKAQRKDKYAPQGSNAVPVGPK